VASDNRAKRRCKVEVRTAVRGLWPAVPRVWPGTWSSEPSMSGNGCSGWGPYSFDCPLDAPENANFHLPAMLMGSLEVISIVYGDTDQRDIAKTIAQAKITSLPCR